MKKTVILLVTAFVACVSCIKEKSEPVSQEGTTIIATTEATKATVDGLQVQWTTGDQVALFISDGSAEPFTLVGEGPVVEGKFHSATYSPTAARQPVGYAAFPAEDASFSGTKITMKVPAEIPYGTSPVPMVGKSTGAIRIIYQNLPPYPCTFILKADKAVAGTLEIADYNSPRNAAYAAEGASNIFTVTGIPKEGDAEITLPLPAGTYHLGVALLAADGTTIVPRSNRGSETAPATVTIEAGKIAKMKPIDLEEGGKVTHSLTSPGATLNPATLPGKWNVLNNHKGFLVFGGSGGSGYPSFISPSEKGYNWDDSVYKEADNELVIRVTNTSGTVVTGTMNWWAGADGQFWNYIWKFQKDGDAYLKYIPFYGTDLSAYYNKIPKGNHEFTLDLSTMKATLSNGETPEILIPGTHTFTGGKTLKIEDGNFGLMFHLHNMMPAYTEATWLWKDIDRFMFCPLEYVIIFERTGDL